MSVKTILFAAVCLAACGTSLAGTYTGKVTPYFYHGGMYISVAADLQKSAVPACATRPLLRLEDAQDSLLFKQKFSILLAAFYAGRPVYLEGTGQCTSEGDEIVGIVVPQ